MKKKRLVVKDSELRAAIKSIEAKRTRRNFLELLRRAARTISKS